MSETLKIIPYDDKYSNDFNRLNCDWIEKYFELEAEDIKFLSNPKSTIIDVGGHIVFALLGEEVVGTCALLKTANAGDYELAKMAVDPKVQGKKIGLKLGQAIIDKAHDVGGKNLYLETSTKLGPAINLYEKLGFVEIPKHESPYARCNLQMHLVLTN